MKTISTLYIPVLHNGYMEFFKKRASVELEKLAHSHLSFE